MVSKTDDDDGESDKMLQVGKNLRLTNAGVPRQANYSWPRALQPYGNDLHQQLHHSVDSIRRICLVLYKNSILALIGVNDKRLECRRLKIVAI